MRIHRTLQPKQIYLSGKTIFLSFRNRQIHMNHCSQVKQGNIPQQTQSSTRKSSATSPKVTVLKPDPIIIQPQLQSNQQTKSTLHGQKDRFHVNSGRSDSRLVNNNSLVPGLRSILPKNAVVSDIFITIASIETFNRLKLINFFVFDLFLGVDECSTTSTATTNATATTSATQICACISIIRNNYKSFSHESMGKFKPKIWFVAKPKYHFIFIFIAIICYNNQCTGSIIRHFTVERQSYTKIHSQRNNHYSIRTESDSMIC